MRSKIEELTDGPLWLAPFKSLFWLMAGLVAAAYIVGAVVGPVLLVVVIVAVVFGL